MFSFLFTKENEAKHFSSLIATRKAARGKLPPDNCGQRAWVSVNMPLHLMKQNQSMESAALFAFCRIELYQFRQKGTANQLSIGRQLIDIELITKIIYSLCFLHDRAISIRTEEAVERLCTDYSKLKQNKSRISAVFFAIQTIELYQLGQKEAMEQLWTGLQSNELESITKICGNSCFFEHRATLIELQPQRSLYLAFPLPKVRSEVVFHFCFNGKSCCSRRGPLGGSEHGVQSSNIAPHSNGTESITEMSNVINFSSTWTTSIEL